jgi:hypothetical protein
MQLALMMIRGEGPRSTEQARRERVAVVRASVATLPRVVEAVVVKALATKVLVAELNHINSVKCSDFEISSHLEGGRRVEGRSKQVKTRFIHVRTEPLGRGDYYCMTLTDSSIILSDKLIKIFVPICSDCT